MKKITLLALLTIVGILGVGQMVFAASSTLSALPASLNSIVGTPFNVSVQLNPAGNKICVVKGTISLNNLTCQNITVASGIWSPVSPTCTNPKFILGIPKCTTAVQNILSVSVKGAQVGQGKLSFTEVKGIGTGAAVTLASQDGAYNITPVQATTPITTPTANTTQKTTQPTQQPTTQQVTTPVQQTSQGPSTTGQQASLATTSPAKTIIIIGIVLLIIIIIGGLWYFINKKKNNQKV